MFKQSKPMPVRKMKMNRTKIIIILLGAGLVISSSIAGYLYVRSYVSVIYNAGYIQGMNDSQISINNNIISQLNQKGYVDISLLSGNQTVSIKLVPSK